MLQLHRTLYLIGEPGCNVSFMALTAIPLLRIRNDGTQRSVKIVSGSFQI